MAASYQYFRDIRMVDPRSQEADPRAQSLMAMIPTWPLWLAANITVV
jgi:hypothetical protein